MRHLDACVVAVGLTIATASMGEAATAVCAPHEVVVTRLANAYGEVPRYRGMTDANYTIEIFASASFETWTMTMRRAGDQTCIIASGRGRPALDVSLEGLS
ncbi:MAG: hypothetical protein AAGI50_15170 [Pseudomonadota bacterium]